MSRATLPHIIKRLHQLGLLTAMLCQIDSTTLLAQSVSINATGAKPDSSAMLDVRSTTKGMLVPRMTQAQRDAIANPGNGLLVFITDGMQGFYHYDSVSTSWDLLPDSSQIAAMGFADNLGNHALTQNLDLDTHWISRDGGTNGINFSSDGGVGINTPANTGDIRLDIYRPTNNTEMRLQSGGDNDVLYRMKSLNDEWYMGIGGVPKKFRIWDEGRSRSALTIDTFGYVGIGVNNPQDQLHVDGDLRFEEGNNVLIYVEDRTTASSGGNSIRIESGDAGAGGWGVSGGNVTLQAGDAYNAGGAGVGGYINLVAGGNQLGNNSHGNITFSTRDQTTTVERMRIRGANGYVGINTSSPSYTLHVNGSVAGTSAYTNLSDRRYKTNIRPIDDALGKINALTPVSYDWKRTVYPDIQFEFGRGIGFIAQDVEPVVPEMVLKDENGVYSLQYSELIPILTKAIQEQSASIDQLRLENEALKHQIEQIQATLNASQQARPDTQHSTKQRRDEKSETK